MDKNDSRLSTRLFLILALLLLPAAGAHAAAERPAPDSYKAALVYDFQTNQVLFQDRAHERADPASLVKMMVALITMERVASGEIELDDRVQVSAKASRIGGHQVYLKQGEVFPLHELLRAVIMASANDASFAVAEYVAGSQEKFVQLMNARARELGMRETRFTNAHGLPANKRKGEESNYTTAYDLALLAREVMKHDKVMEWAATRTGTFRDGQMMLVNTNRRFLQGFKGADGFKTGYHPRGAGFSVVATAQREGRRLVAVVMGAQSARNRLRAVTQLMELGFSNKLGRHAESRPLVPEPLVIGAPMAALELAEANTAEE